MKNKRIQEVLTRGVAEILPGREALANLINKKKIRLYFGIDPTGPNLHLGHAVLLRKLRDFQELGHHIILLIGDFTAQIGDPSGRDKKREALSRAQIEKNMARYKKEAAKIIDLSKTEVRYNSEWLSKLSLKNVIELCSQFTVARLLERDMFQRRIERGEEIWMAELLYPLLQGYDSVALDVDLEIGATDQTFNMLIGRKLQKIYHKKEKFILTTPYLLGLDGRKMSKTYHNTINLDDPPKEMYGKVMSIRDGLIPQYFELLTDLPLPEIEKIKEEIGYNKSNPIEIKSKLAREIVAIYHSERAAILAEREFNRVFREQKMPSDIPEVKMKEKVLSLLDLLVESRLAKSKAEAKRLVLQGGIKINKAQVKDWKKAIAIEDGMIIQVGKRKFVRVKRY